MKINSYKKRNQGLIMDDPFSSFVKGYDYLWAKARDAMDLHNEVSSVQSALFPFQSIAVPGRPGYTQLSRGYFNIESDDPVVAKDLNAYFLEENSRFRENLYGHDDSLGGFLQEVAHSLLVTGESYSLVTWDTISINGRNYCLPVDFGYVRAETMRKGRDQRMSYIQVYSWFTYLKTKGLKDYDGHTQPRVSHFTADEILYYTYPFSRKTPVQRALRHLEQVQKFWQFGLAQTRGSVEVESHYLPFERARYANSYNEKRKHDIARAKIRTVFNYPLDTNGIKMTSYYDLFTVIRYKKYLNEFREYLVQEFNRQILESIVTKNHGMKGANLRLTGFVRNSQLDADLARYTKGEITFEQILESAIRPS